VRERDWIDLLVVGSLIATVGLILIAPYLDWLPIIVGVVIVMFVLMRIYLPMPWQSGIRWRSEDKPWNIWIGPGRERDDDDDSKS